MLPISDLCSKNPGSVCMLVNLHALTTVQDAEQLGKNTYELAVDMLALGIDPDKTLFFRQSDVPEHCELTWILSTLAPIGLLQRAHSFKDKVAKGIEPSAGLFLYPVLMACDILLYDADIVPVGKDQKQHLEITRDLAEKFNHTYSETFVLPEPQISEETAVVPGTDGQKMSKSYGNTIEIFAEEKALKKQIMGIVTDSTPVEEPKEPKGNSIYQLYCLFANEAEQQELAEKFRAGGMGYGDAKKILFEKANTYLAPLRKKRTAMAAKPDLIHDVLNEGAKKAREICGKKMEEVKRKVGV